MTHKEQYLESLSNTFAEALMTVEGKVEDYAEESDSFSNFRFAALAAGVTVEQVLLVLLGIKLARLKTLIVSDREPNNESIEDTLVDSVNYNGILKSYLELKNSDADDYAFADSTPLTAEENDALHVEANLGDPVDSDVPPSTEPEPFKGETEVGRRLLDFFGLRKRELN